MTTAHGTLPVNPLSRKRLHELVDELSEDHVEAAERYLRSLRNQDDPAIRALRAAPVDDEALGHKDRKGIDDGRRDIAAGRGIPEDKFAASTNYDMAPDQDPTRRNRRRLTERGLVRFEVLGRDCDRELIRTWPDDWLRRVRTSTVCAPSSAKRLAAELHARAESCERCAARPWAARTSPRNVLRMITGRSICEPLSDEHRNHVDGGGIMYQRR